MNQQKPKRVKRSVDGVLLLNKPKGGSSNHVLQRVKYLFQAKKAGHTGALDPLASGLLPICFGEATKFSQFLLDADKEYQVVMKLGERTTTSDAEGEVIDKRTVPDLSKAEIEALLQSFVGEQTQIPSMYSALKYEGKPLYYYARKGIDVPRKSRSITIFSINVISVATDTVSFSVHCSKGTYVRTLVDDFGEKLGCGAHVTYLHRTKVGHYQGQDMIGVEQLQALHEKGGQTVLDTCLLPVDSALLAYPKVLLSEPDAKNIIQGKLVQVSLQSFVGLCRVYHHNDFIGCALLSENGELKARRLVSQVA